MRSSLHQRWSGQAFGLSIRSEFALPGLREDGPLHGGRPLTISLLAPAELDERQLGARVCEWRDNDRVTLAIDSGDPGYRFLVTGVGLYELSADGQRVRCCPVPAAGWEWRRYLIGQVLPFAAVLQGLEVFHASAVEIDGRAMAFSGASGLGKSTLALELHLAGGGFVTDDVLALEMRGGEVFAHSGIAMAKVRRTSRAGLLEVRRAVTPVDEPVLLDAFCLLEPSRHGDVHVTEIAGPEARYLLGSTFNLVVATPERLVAQLDICSAITEQARMLRVAVPRELGAGAALQLHRELVSTPVAA